MKFQIVLSVVTIFSFLSLSGCLRDDTPTPVSADKQLETDLAAVDKTRLQSDLLIIDDSLQMWGITPLTEPNGVRYTIQTQGTGAKPLLSSYIKINYKAKLLKNKSVIDQGTNVTFPLTDLIIGWRTSLPLINVGSKFTLYVPSGFAYGSTEKVDPVDKTVIMPANSNLIFEIELLDTF